MISHLDTPRSWCFVDDAQTGSEIFKQHYGQSLRHDIGELLSSRNVRDAYVPNGHLFPDEVDIQLHMFSTTMMNWILGQVNGGDVVTVHKRGFVELDVKFAEKVTEPTTFSSRVRHTTVLSLGTGARHDGLSFGGPRLQRVAEEDAEAGRRAACVGAAGPASEYAVSDGVEERRSCRPLCIVPRT